MDLPELLEVKLRCIIKLQELRVLCDAKVEWIPKDVTKILAQKVKGISSRIVSILQQGNEKQLEEEITGMQEKIVEVKLQQLPGLFEVAYNLGSSCPEHHLLAMSKTLVERVGQEPLVDLQTENVQLTARINDAVGASRKIQPVFEALQFDPSKKSHHLVESEYEKMKTAVGQITPGMVDRLKQRIIKFSEKLKALPEDTDASSHSSDISTVFSAEIEDSEETAFEGLRAEKNALAAANGYTATLREEFKRLQIAVRSTTCKKADIAILSQKFKVALKSATKPALKIQPGTKPGTKTKPSATNTNGANNGGTGNVDNNDGQNNSNVQDNNDAPAPVPNTSKGTVQADNGSWFTATNVVLGAVGIGAAAVLHRYNANRKESRTSQILGRLLGTKPKNKISNAAIGGGVALTAVAGTAYYMEWLRGPINWISNLFGCGDYYP